MPAMSRKFRIGRTESFRRSFRTPSEWPCAVSRPTAVDLRFNQRGDAVHHIVRYADGCAAKQTARCSSRAELGYCCALLNVLDGDEAARDEVSHPPAAVFQCGAWRRICLRAVSRSVPDRRGDEVILGHHVRRSCWSNSRFQSGRSRLVRMPTSLPFSVIGTPEMRYARHQLLRVATPYAPGEG